MGLYCCSQKQPTQRMLHLVHNQTHPNSKAKLSRPASSLQAPLFASRSSPAHWGQENMILSKRPAGIARF